VLQQLKDIDQVAYVRFASVYRKFDNIDSFMEELKALKKLDAKKPYHKASHIANFKTMYNQSVIQNQLFFYNRFAFWLFSI